MSLCLSGCMACETALSRSAGWMTEIRMRLNFSGSSVRMVRLKKVGYWKMKKCGIKRLQNVIVSDAL